MHLNTCPIWVKSSQLYEKKNVEKSNNHNMVGCQSCRLYHLSSEQLNHFSPNHQSLVQKPGFFDSKKKGRKRGESFGVDRKHRVSFLGLPQGHAVHGARDHLWIVFFFFCVKQNCMVKSYILTWWLIHDAKNMNLQVVWNKSENFNHWSIDPGLWSPNNVCCFIFLVMLFLAMFWDLGILLYDDARFFFPTCKYLCSWY